MSGPPKITADTELSDILLIVVGKTATAEKEVRRRVESGGRVLWLWTDCEPKNGKTENATCRISEADFYWQLPQQRNTSDTTLLRLRRELHSTPASMWLKPGPDIHALGDKQTYHLDPTGLTLLKEGTGEVLWQVSGKTLLATPGAGETEQSTADEVKKLINSGFPLMNSRVHSFWLCSALTLFTAWYILSEMNEGVENGAEYRAPWWRLPAAVNAMFCFGQCVTSFWGVALTGAEQTAVPVRIFHAVNCFTGFVLFALVPLFDGNLTMFWTAAFGTSMHLGAAFGQHMYATGFPTYWKWAFVAVNTTLGAWMFFYCVSVGYILLINVSPGLANIYLPIATTFSETLFVGVLGKAYRWWVYGLGAKGDQHSTLLICICLCHSYAESVKLVSMMCNGVIDKGYGWLQSVFLSLVLDVLARFGWLRYTQVRLLSGFAPALADALRPSAVTKMHDEAKFSFGYPRFVVPGAILIGRLLMGHSFETALYNLPAMAAFLITLAVEFLEDFIVSKELCVYAPAPDVEVYKAIANLDPGQLFVFEQRAGQNVAPSKVGTTAEASEGESSSSPRKSTGSGSFSKLKDTATMMTMRRGANRRSLLLHGSRDASFWANGVAMAPATLFGVCLLQLLLGTGFVAGVCDTPLDPADRIKELFYVVNPVRCLY